MDWTFLNRHRLRRGQMGSDESFGFNGVFSFALAGEARRVFCMASDGMGWEHVSVSFGAGSKSVPSWALMCAVRDLFWPDDVAVIQIHPPRSEYINNHPGCLHLWRCTDGREQPLPSSIMVGLKELNPEGNVTPAEGAIA